MNCSVSQSFQKQFFCVKLYTLDNNHKTQLKWDIQIVAPPTKMIFLPPWFLFRNDIWWIYLVVDVYCDICFHTYIFPEDRIYKPGSSLPWILLCITPNVNKIRPSFSQRGVPALKNEPYLVRVPHRRWGWDDYIYI